MMRNFKSGSILMLLPSVLVSDETRSSISTVKSALLTPSAMEYTPVKEGQMPTESHQSAQLYYFGQNRTPLSRIQQYPGLRGDAQPMQGSQLKTPNSGCSARRGNSHAFHNSRTPSSTKSGKV